MLIWACIVVLCITFWRKTRINAYEIVKEILQKKVMAILVSFAFYCLIVVLYLNTKISFEARHYWVALLWVLISGYGSVFTTVSSSSELKARMLWNALANIFSISALLGILVSLRSFHWIVEIVLLLVILITVYQANRENTISNLSNLFKGILSILGVILLSYSTLALVTNPSAFLKGSFLLEISLPALLSLFCVPFLYGLFLVVCYESSMTRLPKYLTDIGLMSYARSSALIAFAWDVESLRNWVNLVKCEEPDSKASVQETISIVYRKTALRRRVYTSKGDGSWNPFNAQMYLSRLGLHTSKYHVDEMCETEWRAMSTYQLIGDDPIENAIAYYIYGEEFRACKLLIRLNVNVPSKFDEAWAPFKEYILELSQNALSHSTLDMFRENINDSRTFSISTNMHTISLSRNVWKHNKLGGFDMSFSIEANS